MPLRGYVFAPPPLPFVVFVHTGAGVGVIWDWWPSRWLVVFVTPSYPGGILRGFCLFLLRLFPSDGVCSHFSLYTYSRVVRAPWDLAFIRFVVYSVLDVYLPV